ncbi:hypothetical protein EGW03_06630, partial [bacterium]|nr:hypothetical protein [bacterium]
FSDGSMNDKTFTLTVNVYADGKVVNAPTTQTLSQMILDSNQIITKAPTLTTSSNNTTDASGLYKSTDTNTGDPTYYFRGNVENNYVSFAGFTWRIVRINEDGTIRIIMQDGINNNTNYQFNSNYSSYIYMYYTNSQAKNILDSWYQTNIGSKFNLIQNVVSGNYYCEQAKTKLSDNWGSGSATMTTYTSYMPDFKCSADGNGKGLVNSNIGLLSYDELIYSGGYYEKDNTNYYLYNSNIYWWTMSPAGFGTGSSPIWTVPFKGTVDANSVHATLNLRPVLNLTADTQISDGDGTINSPFIVK